LWRLTQRLSVSVPNNEKVGRRRPRPNLQLFSAIDSDQNTSQLSDLLCRGEVANVRFGSEADINKLFNNSSVSVCGGTVFGANEAQVADDFIAAAAIRRMVDAVDHRHVGKIKRAHAF